jgi:hypothetical protein
MNSKLKFLKVKIKSLAAEQGIIRLEKRKALQCKKVDVDLVNALQAHRVLAVRPEARASLLAYGLLRGQTRDQIEPRAKSEPNVKRVNDMIRKYGLPGDQLKLIG